MGDPKPLKLFANTCSTCRKWWKNSIPRARFDDEYSTCEVDGNRTHLKDKCRFYHAFLTKDE